MPIPLKGYRVKLCFLMTCIKAFSKKKDLYRMIGRFYKTYYTGLKSMLSQSE